MCWEIVVEWRVGDGGVRVTIKALRLILRAEGIVHCGCQIALKLRIKP